MHARHFEVLANAIERHQSGETVLSTADLREDLGKTRICDVDIVNYDLIS